MTETPGPEVVLQPVSAEDLPLDPTDFGAGQFGEALLDEDEEENGDDESPGSDLDERAKQDFIGLMYLGYLEDECRVAGHRFKLQTPWHDERLERGMLHKPAIGTMNFEPLWELLTVAAYLTEIDGRPAPEPLGPKSGAVSTRLTWVKESIFSSVIIRLLFNKTLELDARERAVVEYLDDQSKA